jgi:ribosomal protein S27AE
MTLSKDFKGTVVLWSAFPSQMRDVERIGQRCTNAEGENHNISQRCQKSGFLAPSSGRWPCGTDNANFSIHVQALRKCGKGAIL